MFPGRIKVVDVRLAMRVVVADDGIPPSIVVQLQLHGEILNQSAVGCLPHTKRDAEVERYLILS